MVIWASVTPGSKVEVALRTAARAAAGSFCSAMARTPSRAAAESWPCTWKAWPNSTMPTTRRTSSGTISANSTALAPRSSRSRRRSMAVLLPGVDVGAAQRPEGGGPLRRGDVRGGSVAAGEGVGDHREEVVELAAEQQHRADDDGGDQADHEAVLDGGRALLLALQAVLGEGHERGQGGERVHHGGCSWGMRTDQDGPGWPAVAALRARIGCSGGGLKLLSPCGGRLSRQGLTVFTHRDFV